MAAKTLAQSGVLYTDRRDFYINPTDTKELWPDVAPFLTLVSNLSTRGTTDPDYKMFEHRSGFEKQQLQVNDATPAAWTSSGNPGSTVTVTVDGLTGLGDSISDAVIGLKVDIWADNAGAYGAYKGQAYIQSRSGNDLTLVGLGNVGQSDNNMDALADNDYLYVIDNAAGEGTTSPEAFADDLTVVYNSTQIMRTPLEVTGTLYEASLRGYNREFSRLQMEKAKEFAIQRERAFLFGVRRGGIGFRTDSGDPGENDSFSATISDSSGNVVRTTMGAISALRKYGYTSGDNQNVFSITTGSYTFSDMVDQFQLVGQYTPTLRPRLVMFCGRGALAEWQKIASDVNFFGTGASEIQIDNATTDSLGLNVRRLITPFCEVDLVVAPAMRGPYNKYAVIVNPDCLERVIYRPEQYKANIKTDDGYDGQKDEFFSDEGVGLTMVEKHFLFTFA